MKMEDFEVILDKLQQISGIRRIALNHYNEPFMDPYIVERIQAILSRDMTRWVILYTNASMIRAEQLVAFRPFRQHLGFNVNLPTVLSKERYREIHGRNDLEKVEKNLVSLIEQDFLVQINVQANHHTTREDYQSVVEKYGPKVKKVNWIRSSTRSNLTLNETYSHRGRILGCTLYRHLNYLHIGVDGGVFLCAEDYFKKSEFGNILTDSLPAVLNAPQRKLYLDYLSGRKKAPADFICRSCKHAIVEETALSGLTDYKWFFELAQSNNLFNRF